MSKVSTSPTTFIHKLKEALADGLSAVGIDAEVTFEAVRMTKLYRVLVVAKQFKHMRPSERQDLVWRIASSTLSPAEQLRISMILTLTPDEMQGNW